MAPTPVTEKSFDNFEFAWFTAWNSAPQVSIYQGRQGYFEPTNGQTHVLLMSAILEVFVKLGGVHKVG